jgi:hypothetical protein
VQDHQLKCFHQEEDEQNQKYDSTKTKKIEPDKSTKD